MGDAAAEVAAMPIVIVSAGARSAARRCHMDRWPGPGLVNRARRAPVSPGFPRNGSASSEFRTYAASARPSRPLNSSAAAEMPVRLAESPVQQGSLRASSGLLISSAGCRASAWPIAMQVVTAAWCSGHCLWLRLCLSAEDSRARPARQPRPARLRPPPGGCLFHVPPPKRCGAACCAGTSFGSWLPCGGWRALSGAWWRACPPVWGPHVGRCLQDILVARRLPARHDAVAEKAGAAYADVAHNGISPDSEDLSGGEQCIRLTGQQRDVHGGVQYAL